MPKFIDLTGLRFSRLMVIERVYRQNSKRTFWKCICDYGNIITTNARGLRIGTTHSCGCYRIEKLIEAIKFSYDYVKKYFSDHGCELLSSEYVRTDYNLTYKCNCGNIAEITFGRFKQGQRCMKCMSKVGALKRTGKNNGSWKTSKTDEERLLQRKYPEYLVWRNAVIEKLGNCCAKCGDKRGTQVYHLDSYGTHKDKRLDVSNGVVLCFSCHKKFHEIYGKFSNIKEQFIDFLNNVASPIKKTGIIRKKSDRVLEFMGERKTVTDWAESLKIPRTMIYGRLNNGWPVEKTLKLPHQFPSRIKGKSQ